MILLLDENLSEQLVASLQRIFPGVTHVNRMLSRSADDMQVWHLARLMNAVIVTRDADFAERVHRQGSPPHVVWINSHNPSNRAVEWILRCNIVAIKELMESESGCLVLPG